MSFLQNTFTSFDPASFMNEFTVIHCYDFLHELFVVFIVMMMDANIYLNKELGS